MKLKLGFLKVIVSVLAGVFGLYFVMGLKNIVRGQSLPPYKEYILSFYNFFDVAIYHWIYLIITIVVVYLVWSWLEGRK